MIRKERVIENVLDVVIRIISLANVQSLHETRNKKHLLGVLGVIAKMKPKTKLLKKLVSWLNRQIRSPSSKVGLGFDKNNASTSETKKVNFVRPAVVLAGDGSTIKANVCLRIGLEPDEWIKDISCSKHMMENKSLFSNYKAYDGGTVVFGSNLKGKIIGKGYSENSKAYIILNKHTMKVKESLNVTFNESPPPTKLSPLVDDDVGEEVVIERKVKVDNNV
ncbi:hypothetical protein Tco_0492358 [Tanacetum coccineum]